MTPEQRLDRLERIAKLFVKAGLRARRQSREQDEKINILINLQIRNDEKFAQNEAKFAKHEAKAAQYEAKAAQYEAKAARYEAKAAKHDAKFANLDGQMANLLKLHERTEARFVRLAESQTTTDRKLQELIDLIRAGRNGNSSGKS